MEIDDVRQELLVTLHATCLSWAARGDAPLIPVLITELRWQALHLTRKGRARKARLLLRSLSIDKRIAGGDGDTHAHSLRAKPEADPAIAAARGEAIDMQAEALWVAGTPTARAAAPLLMLGLDHRQAAELLNDVGWETRQGPPGRDATRVAIGRAHRAMGHHRTHRRQPVEQLDETGVVANHKSITAAAKAIGCTPGRISEAVNGNAQTAGGFRWRRARGADT
jgi:hypothetical protein